MKNIIDLPNEDVQHCNTMNNESSHGGSIPLTRSPSENRDSVEPSVESSFVSFHCNKCGYAGSEEKHNGCNYNAATLKTAPRYRYFDENGEHLHTLDGYPLVGTSTACKVLGKELTWWASGMALAPLGWLNKRKSKVEERNEAAIQAQRKITAMPPKEYRDFLEECYRAHNTRKETAAVSGKDMHAALERYIKECMDAGGVRQFDKYEHEAVEIFAGWAAENVEEFLWSEGHCYSERLWAGGICDCGAILRDDKRSVAVIDFKSSREAYWDQFIQAGGYALAIQENGLFHAEGKLKIGRDEFTGLSFGALIVFPFGAYDGSEPPPTVVNVADWMRAFEATVTLSKVKSTHFRKSNQHSERKTKYVKKKQVGNSQGSTQSRRFKRS